jgi:hypothetical protein
MTIRPNENTEPMPGPGEPGYVRRVVTGSDASGRGVVLSDGPAPMVLSNASGYRMVEMWATEHTPPDMSGEDISARPFELEPPAGGMHWRLVVWPVSHEWGKVHRTDTLDLLHIISGECTLGVGDEEKHEVVRLRAGDSIVALGNVHFWRNTGTTSCTAVATMVSSLPVD